MPDRRDRLPDRKRWRNGRKPTSTHKGRRPLNGWRPPAAPSRHLREADRIHIADRLWEKATVRAIAAELGRSPSTISREIRRNSTVHPRGGRHYRPHAAQDRADARRPRPKPGKIGQNPELRDFIQDRLDLRWSPEQIPDLKLDIKRVIAEGEMVVTHSHLDLEPGNPDNPGRALADYFRLEDGKVVEHWDVIQHIPVQSANDNGMF